MARPGTTRRRWLALGLGTVLAFLAAEIAVRLLPGSGSEIQSGRSPMASWAHVDAFCAYRAIPGRYLSQRKTVNADGFLSTPPLSRAKPTGTLRIAFLGGSSTAGTVPYLGDTETWPWLVTESLRQAFPAQRIEFLNAALPGYSTFESYGRLWSRVRFFAPDIVVVYHGWNDMYYFADAARVARWRVGDDGDWTFRRPDRVVDLASPAVPAWAAWSRLLSVACRASAPPPGEVGPLEAASASGLAPDFDPAAVGVFRQNLQLMFAAQQVLGFELHVCKQATLIVPGLPEAARATCGYSLHGFDHDAHVRAFDAVYGAIDDVMPAGRVIDLRPLSGSTVNLVDHIHLSAEGARNVAAIVAEHLRQRLAARVAAPKPGR